MASDDDFQLLLALADETDAALDPQQDCGGHISASDGERSDNDNANDAILSLANEAGSSSPCRTRVRGPAGQAKNLGALSVSVIYSIRVA